MGSNEAHSVEIRKDGIIFKAPATDMESYGRSVARSASAAAQLGFVGWAFSVAPVPLVAPAPCADDASGLSLSPDSCRLAAQGPEIGD